MTEEEQSAANSAKKDALRAGYTEKQAQGSANAAALSIRLARSVDLNRAQGATATTKVEQLTEKH